MIPCKIPVDLIEVGEGAGHGGNGGGACAKWLDGHTQHNTHTENTWIFPPKYNPMCFSVVLMMESMMLLLLLLSYWSLDASLASGGEVVAVAPW